MNTSLIVIVGPTASGKSGLAVKLARQFNGEVISADSRQIYRDLNIGTEKISNRDMRGVPHHCIDIASPRRACSVTQWRRYAERAIRGCVRHGTVPIVAGGTGLYVDALVYGTEFPEVPPNTTLRNELSKLSTDVLFDRLCVLDPERAATIEKKNPRRLMRAIEIVTALGAVPKVDTKKERYKVLWIGINPPFELLEQRIQKRLTRALHRGLVAETRHLHNTLGLSWKRIDELGLEYSTVAAYLRAEISKQEMKEKLYQDVRRYAKRQLRWLKRNPNITWYTSAEDALQKIKVPGTFILHEDM